MHHVVANYDGSSIKIFVDGDLENTCDGGVLLSQDRSSPITLGVYRPGTSNYQSNGSLDELTIWNTSLSDEYAAAYSSERLVFQIVNSSRDPFD